MPVIPQRILEIDAEVARLQSEQLQLCNDFARLHAKYRPDMLIRYRKRVYRIVKNRYSTSYGVGFSYLCRKLRRATPSEISSANPDNYRETDGPHRFKRILERDIEEACIDGRWTPNQPQPTKELRP